MKYVIIGNATAGIACVEGIRSVDTEGEITIISDEPFAAYGRPLISYYLLGATDREHMLYRPADFYEKNKVKTLLGARAEKIDVAAKKIVLRGGKEIPYDKLLVATGSRPFEPPMEGIEGVKDTFNFMTMQDALSLEKALSRRKSVLIVGAGLIGLKCLEGIAERVKSVSVVDMADRVLPSVLDEAGAGIVRRALEKKGAAFYLSDSVAKFDKNTAHLKSGKEIPFDILVVAVGVRPNTELVKNAGGEVRRGIVTDEKQRTSIENVYAAGDCAESLDITSGERKILALLPNAYRQGYTAGVNMAGGDAAFTEAMPLNAVGFFGTQVLTAGSYTGESYTETAGERYRKLFYKEGVLKGFILVNAPERAGIYTALIRNKTPLAEVDFESLKTAPQLAAFPKTARERMLAREV
ncbi:MAG TPA: FAD-dependent oxidoreductase [Candidatus Borkfalkia excrementigallinarum]|uniref:FAD-dependent oxidoreductase n=1 Tax=Candidatus Borkfalkia excrementigallinarum TaxID=2838506 RepID=A0A9D2CSE8_9FIRM|nr:FAD-dependent oxidoreductase [Candidatus Borkfalkia excrementigallinarum]